MGRQSRERRRAGVQVKLTARDELLLQALARFRIARTGDLIRLAFAGIRRDTCVPRLRRLFDAGYLDVRVGDRATENVYSLGPKGRRWLVARGGVIGRLPKGGHEHHLAIVSAWAALARTAHEIHGLSLELVRPDWQIREHATAACPLVPDALIQIGVGNRGVVRLALEVDLGTEPVTILRRKITCYESLRQGDEKLFGWPSFALAVALVGAGASRRPAMERLLASVWSGPWLLWQDDEGLRTALRSLVGAAQTPLTTSPYRKGREASVTPCGSERSRADEAGL